MSILKLSRYVYVVGDVLTKLGLNVNIRERGRVNRFSATIIISNDNCLSKLILVRRSIKPRSDLHHGIALRANRRKFSIYMAAESLSLCVPGTLEHERMLPYSTLVSRRGHAHIDAESGTDMPAAMIIRSRFLIQNKAIFLMVDAPPFPTHGHFRREKDSPGEIRISVNNERVS